MTEPEQAEITKLTAFVETMPADLLTPLAVYLKLAESNEHSFLFESVAGGEQVARYSFIGADPESVTSGGREAFESLKRHFEYNFASSNGPLPPFTGGAVGYLGFDCCEWFEPSLSSKENSASCAFMFYRSVIAFDHAKQIINIISLEPAEYEQRARERNASIRSLLESPGSFITHSPSSIKRTGEYSSNWARPAFENAVSRIKELIAAGECYQAVLSQCFTRLTDASPVAIYRALRSLNPSPYMFLMRMGERSIVGASPEMLVKCSGRKLFYRPIAGTRPRGSDQAADDRLADEMRSDAKEVAEHLMLVDLGRNDLGRVSRFGSVAVESLMSVEKYSHVQHLVSSITSELAGGKDRFDALAACFPAGTVSGAPKVRAIEIIRDLEPTPRGVYAGGIGYFDYSGNMDICIAIRTVVIENGVARIQAGAGIVADSDPSSEFDETVNKAAGLLRAIDLAEGIR